MVYTITKYISGMLGWFNIQKSITVICHVEKKWKNIWSTQKTQKKAFDKNQKTLS